MTPIDHFDGPTAEGYDESTAKRYSKQDTAATVALLADLAGDGPALELGVGTGRIAIPLSERGVTVHGIDLSPAMVAELSAKPGSERIGVTIGDIAGTRVGGAFSLVYIVFNTIMNLTTQEAQVACFRNAASHLRPGGRFLVEVDVPALRRLPPGECFRTFEFDSDHWGVDEYRVATQTLVSHHFERRGGEFRRWSIPFRYVWPAELDLMAQLACMSLENRWSGPHREPFTDETETHVSVWRRARARR